MSRGGADPVKDRRHRGRPNPRRGRGTVRAQETRPSAQNGRGPAAASAPRKEGNRPRSRRRTAATTDGLPPGICAVMLASGQRSTDSIGAGDTGPPGFGHAGKTGRRGQTNPQEFAGQRDLACRVGDSPRTGAESSTVRRRPPGGLTFNGTGPPPGKTTPAVTPPGVGSLPALPPAPPPQRSRPRRPLQVAAPVAETPTGFVRRTRFATPLPAPRTSRWTPLQTPGAAEPFGGEVLQQIEPRIGLTLSDS
ncbi:hypothetical protein CBS63078_11328 [Aspergillus niger]|nr:hypothetical protein CBS63078_11328 [Aspergillus niger]